MFSSPAHRRLTVLFRILCSTNAKISIKSRKMQCKRTYSEGMSVVTIGDVKRAVNEPGSYAYIPRKYLNNNLDQETLHHLRWMLQKDELEQDMFLIGRPGPSKRRLAMQYLELTKREVEFVSLSRDTTEADLKQRREIKNGTAKYLDQSAVRAAIAGRVLILEGIEKAERNVLPVLNNLLENREMHLEDGRFLIPAERYDKLLKNHGKNELDRWQLVRASEDFRVIALGLPVPGYHGNPLDPPLRSRFQARDITPPSYKEIEALLLSTYSDVDPSKLTSLLSCSFTMISSESAALGLPDFPLDNVLPAAKLFSNFPWLNVHYVFHRLYPMNSFLTKEGRTSVEGILASFVESEENDVHKINGPVLRLDGQSKGSVKISCGSDTPVPVEVLCGDSEFQNTNDYVKTNYQDSCLAELIQSHSVFDICVIGPRGCGKSLLVTRLAHSLGYRVEPVVMYHDMTSRDFIQQRSTLPNGDTIWQNAPLVNAALEGRLTILDGIHRVHPSTLSILHRLVHDRELQLYDGRRLIRYDRYDELVAELGEQKVIESGLLRIHPAFRIVALAEPSGGTESQWINPELLSLFFYHELRSLTAEEEIFIIENQQGRLSTTVRSILGIAQQLRTSDDPTMRALASSLSTRQLLRIARRDKQFPSNDPYNLLQQAVLAKFLPPLARQTLETVLQRAGVTSKTPPSSYNSSTPQITVHDDSVQIGSTVAQRYVTSATSKVPDVLFYDVPQHVTLLERLLQDFTLGEHLLLVGNQGVGKNKLVDRLLNLLNRPREYIQLHRDTTVQALTLQPTVHEGVVAYEDSPLVQAVRLGHVLVVDEADKAPTHVTCILKTLVESGEMILSDGRRIIPAEDPRAIAGLSNIISIHPDFRMIVLANRPGFPFLGNDFFGALGDLFSCHAIDNPSPESEVLLLSRYGPNVPKDLITRLVAAFGKLRDLADQGLVSYPYSTREVVNIVKHLQAFPNDTISNAIGNVFDFDRYSKDVKDTLLEVLNEYKLPVSLTPHSNPEGRKHVQLTIEKESGLDVSSPKHGKVDPKGDPHVGGNTWAGGTGGRDTAGLGGKGGPYRLDAGHTVHQVSDEEKAAVPEHVKHAAREMAKKAFKQRLEEIKMSEYDATVYESFSSAVAKQVQALRVILSSVQAKSKERQWLRHQTSGELDDSKLIEGLTGEKNIFKRRAEKEPEPGTPQMKPKRLKLVVDVSGSMYRFNGYDGRLDRELEAVVLLMEAFQGHESRFQYDIVGHSGEDVAIQFVHEKNPPTNNKQRLDIIKMMHAHAQFCMSGDNTLEATQCAIDSLSKEDCDEAIVIILSDANLSRYAIPPRELAQAINSHPDVAAYVLFIGSLGDQAKRLTNALPAGRSFLCMDVKEIPQILQQIFTASVLNSR
ncbi:von Willebrand factor A domain-containing protein c12.2 [Lycorma delicatula]|uniref:von Willebrand factor A domain-containing protein c12.2 n=1 Tax=Lycorma delicatula TaxID=130591 RepID=UPI003F51A6C9